MKEAVDPTDLKTGSTSKGCLHLIDLAGSERVERSEVTGDRLKEAQHINKSLSALGDVIFALSQKSAHVPYRNSKLTQVLHSSLGGQAKTLMFVQVNPDVESYSESLSTLKFAERVSGVELGAAKSNKEGKDVKDLIEQVASLKNTIARKDEDIEQLQTLKDLRAQSPKSNSFRQSSSFSRVTQQGGGKVMKQTEKDVPDSESNYRDLDAGTLPSMLDDGGNAGESCHADDETGGCDDGELDGRLSDASSGDLSVGEDAEYSMGDAIESEILPEAGKPTQVGMDKIQKTPSRLPKPLSKRTGHALSNRAKISDSFKVQLMKKTASSQVASSSVKQLKR